MIFTRVQPRPRLEPASFSPRAPRVVVVHAEPTLAQLVGTTLAREGLDAAVARAADGVAGRRADFVALDLPSSPAGRTARATRALFDVRGDAPVLLLTVRIPTAAAPQAAEPRAATPAVRAATRERFGDVEVHAASRSVTRAGSPIGLTPKEFDLLVALLRRNGDVASRHDLLREVWGHRRPSASMRTIDVHVAELRRKVEPRPAAPRHILTVWKSGYRLAR